MPENKQENLPLKRRRPFYQTPFFWILLVILIGAGTTFAIIHFTKKPTDPATSSTASTTTDSKSSSTSSNSSAKPDTSSSSETSTEISQDATASEDSSVSPDGKTPSSYDGANPNTSESITGILSAARFSGDNLILRIAIDQYLSGGTCSLVLSDGANRLEKSARLVPVVSTSTCEGFDVASSELSGFARPLYVTVSLTSGDKTGTVEGSVE